MSNSSIIPEDWQILRNLVFEARGLQAMPKIPDSLRSHAAVSLVERYFQDRSDAVIDEAARLVALAKPGVDSKVAERHYWLVLDKS